MFLAKCPLALLSLSSTQVFYASLKLLRLLLSQLIPSLGQSRAEVTHCLEQTWPNLLTRTGESAGRIRAAATAFILVLSDSAASRYLLSAIPQPHYQHSLGEPFTVCPLPLHRADPLQ